MVTAKVDDRKRILIPSAKPGQIVAIIENQDGTITLSPMSPRKRKPSILEGLKPLTDEQARQIYCNPNPEFDALDQHHASLPVPEPE